MNYQRKTMTQLNFKTTLSIIFISTLQLHSSARSINSAKSLSGLTTEQRYHQGAIFMLQGKSNSCTPSPIANVKTLQTLLEPKKSGNEVIQDFIKNTNLPYKIADRPWSKNQINQAVTNLTEKYHPTINRSNSIKIKDFRKIEKAKNAIVSRIVRSKKLVTTEND